MIDNRGDYDSLIGPIEDGMIRSVWRIVRDPDDAADAFQEALATIWERLGRIRQHPNPHALILRICANSAYDVLRRKSRRRRHEEAKAISETAPDPAPSPAQEVAGRENRREVFDAIGRLPRDQAQAVLMRFVQELPYADIAQALDCTEVNARMHISRARVRLRKTLAHLAPSSNEEVL